MATKYAGQNALNKLMQLVKTALSGKLDKTGGTMTGKLTVSGANIDVKSNNANGGNISADGNVSAANGSLTAGVAVSVLNGNNFVNLTCAGSNAAKIAGAGGSYARMAVGTPTGDNDAATKAYVDSKVAAGGADISTILSKVYPVGSIYMSVNSASPATLFGGTWERIKDQFLLAAGDKYAAGKTGGEATHTLTENEIPAHRHSIWFPNAGGEQSAAIGYPEAGSKNTWYAEASKTAGAGGGAAHNNMPPYLTVYVWKRTA